MEKNRVRKFKLFWLWQDEKEEAWLREMALDGLHLSAVAPMVYTFEHGEPRDDVYRLDYMANRSDYGEYRQLFDDAGWEFVGVMTHWHYFRKPAGAQGPHELYTDPESKVERYRRVLAFMIIFLPIVITTLVVDLPGPFKILMAAITLFWAYSIVRIFGRILQLRHI